MEKHRVSGIQQALEALTTVIGDSIANPHTRTKASNEDMKKYVGKFSAYSKDKKEFPFGRPKDQKGFSTFGHFSSIGGKAPANGIGGKECAIEPAGIESNKPIKIIPEHVYNHEISGLPGGRGKQGKQQNFFTHSYDHDSLGTYFGGGSTIATAFPAKSACTCSRSLTCLYFGNFGLLLAACFSLSRRSCW